MPLGNPIRKQNESRMVSVLATEGQTVFTVQGGYIINQLSVFRNGVRLSNAEDFTAGDGSTVTLNNAANIDDRIGGSGNASLHLNTQKTNDFEPSDITLNNIANGTLSDFYAIFEVTVQNSKYFINGIQQDSLVLKSGNTYRFDQSDSSNGSHPLRFSATSTSSGISPVYGVTYDGTQGQSGSYTQIEITGSTPTTLYYYCTAHSGMGDSVSIATTNLTKTYEYKATLTMTAFVNYTINVDAGKFTYNGSNNAAATEFSITRVPWKQLGSDIDGEKARDNSGRSVSLSSDGTIVAIGANDPHYSGTFGDGGPGSVRVYEYKIPTTNEWSLTDDEADGYVLKDGDQNQVADKKYWVKLGSDIDGDAYLDAFGWSVSLSSDGSIVAIGAYGANSDDSGHVKVYERNASNTTVTPIGWTQIGSDIDGEEQGESVGRSVSLSSDGTTLAIGVPDAEVTRVYNKVSITTSGTADTGSGVTVSINSLVHGLNSGDIIVFSNSAKLTLTSNASAPVISLTGDLEYQNLTNNLEGNTWTKKGFDIEGNENTNIYYDSDESGRSIALSSDGSIVAIAAHKNDANNSQNYDFGHVRVYQWREYDPTGEDANAYQTSLIQDPDDPQDKPIIITGGANLGNIIDSTYFWTQIGFDIDGEASYDNSGYSIAISDDGLTVAIGATGNDGNGSVKKSARCGICTQDLDDPIAMSKGGV